MVVVLLLLLFGVLLELLVVHLFLSHVDALQHFPQLRLSQWLAELAGQARLPLWRVVGGEAAFLGQSDHEKEGGQIE